MFQKKAGGIGQIQIIRDTLKVAVKFVLLYRNVLDQNCLASHIYGDLSYFPLVGCDLGSPQRELTAPLQASQKATGEFDVVHEHAVDKSQTVLGSINPDLAGHFLKNSLHAGKRLKARTRLETELDQVAAFPGVLKEECLRDDAQKSNVLFLILLVGLFESLLFRRVVGEPQNSLHLVVLLCAGQWLTRKRDQAVE
jgi:hypothetical protein